MRLADLSGPLEGRRLYQALLGLPQTTGSAGGFDLSGSGGGASSFCVFVSVWGRVRAGAALATQVKIRRTPGRRKRR